VADEKRSKDEEARRECLSQWAFVNGLYDKFGVELPYENILGLNFERLVPVGGWVADIGAHSGFHTRRLRSIVGDEGRIAAFEPLAYFAGLLKDEFGQVANVSVVECALSNFEGEAQFVVARGTPEESGLQQKAAYIFPDKADLENVTVRVRTLDTVLRDWSRLDYVKIDIEGAELDCLEGAVSLLSRFRPIISFECGQAGYGQYGKTARDFLEFSTKHNYNILDLFGNDLSRQDLWYEVVDRARTWDFYYVPAERSAAVSDVLRLPGLP